VWVEPAEIEKKILELYAIGHGVGNLSRILKINAGFIRAVLEKHNAPRRSRYQAVKLRGENGIPKGV
jgi:hypothetical protein